MTKEQKNDSAEAMEFKKASQRLQEYLAANGIKLQHAKALEALTAAVGEKNWRVVREKLNAPTAAAKEVLGPGEPRWMVHAIYTDNNQRFCDDYHGASALEAQIACQLERLTDSGSITEVEIASVIDRATGKCADWESYPEEVALVKFTEMAAMLVKLGKRQLGEPPRSGIAECDEYDRNMRALELWSAIAQEKGKRLTASAELDAMYYEYEPEYDDDPTQFTDSRGVEDTIDVVDAFRRVLDFAEKTLAENGVDLSKCYDDPKKNGVFQVLQARGTLEYFDDKLDKVLNGWELEGSDL